MIRREIQPTFAARPFADRAQGVEIQGGRTLYIPGQVPIDAEGRLVGSDIREQARQVFRNIRALIEEAGGQMRDLVKLTTFLTNVADCRGFVEVHSEFIDPPYPAATLVAVAALVRPEWRLEVEAVAVIESGSERAPVAREQRGHGLCTVCGGTGWLYVAEPDHGHSCVPAIQRCDTCWRWNSDMEAAVAFVKDTDVPLAIRNRYTGQHCCMFDEGWQFAPCAAPPCADGREGGKP